MTWLKPAHLECPVTIGPFRILGRLGAGGMAETFLGARSGPGGFEQRACVKRILGHHAADPELRRLFNREARLAGQLSHRNITRVLDFGEEDGAQYLALELVDGLDLRQLLRHSAGRRLAMQEALLIALEVAEALAHAHRRSDLRGAVVHRDISPANILISLEGEVKLTDFGIAKALSDARSTRSDFVRGNVWYMAPEQIDARHGPDPRSDLFSLGVVLYEALAGCRPYDGPSDAAAMLALSEGRRRPIDEAAPHLPEEVRELIRRLMCEMPGARIQSAAEVVEALASMVKSHPARRALAARAMEVSRRRTPVAEPERAPDLTDPAPPPTLSSPTLSSPALSSRALSSPAITSATRPDRPRAKPVPEVERATPRPEARWVRSGRSWPESFEPYQLGPGVWAARELAADASPPLRAWALSALLAASVLAALLHLLL